MLSDEVMESISILIAGFWDSIVAERNKNKKYFMASI